MTDLTSDEIPIFKQVHPSLISILRAHSEVNLSNLLAYFFRGDYKPELQKIFLTALIDSITIEDNDFLVNMINRDYKAVEVFTEYVTGGGGRIDILIVDATKRESERTAIIIENKLYHELNNDLDDYFYTVSNDFDILTKNIVVVVLSLKPYKADHPENMNWANVRHSELRDGVKAEQEEYAPLNDTHAALLLDEYVKHIDDVYLESFSFGNADCFDYYFKNRAPINAVVKSQSIEASVPISPSRKKDLVTLHGAVETAVREYYDHYIIITSRNVQGPDYFRGRGLSRDLIRYRLDFNTFFNSSGAITLKVDLELDKMAILGIDYNEPRLLSVLRGLLVPFSLSQTDGWYTIKEEQFDIDDPRLNLLFKKIDQRWEPVELVLGGLIKDIMIRDFNESALAALQDSMAGLNPEIKDRQVYFSGIDYGHSVRYSMRLFAPDLVEIILYVNDDHWDEARLKMKKRRGFIKFSYKQSYTIEGLEYENSIGQIERFYALYKKSYRIAKPQADLFLTVAELELWQNLEKDIINKINPLFFEDIEEME